MGTVRGSDHESADPADGAEFFSASQETFTRAEIAPLLRELRAARQALREHEDRLSLALDGADAGLWDWDPITNVLTWTRQMERLYGIEAGAVNMYDHWRSRVHPDDAERVEAERDAALQEQRPFDVEFRTVLPSGEIRWLSARGRGMYDGAGALIRVTGINQDITRRKTAEAERDASHVRLLAQWESAPLASFLWKAEGGDLTLVEINPAAERISKGKAHEFLGMTATQVYPDRPDILEHFRTCLRQQGITRLESDYRARGTGEMRAIEFTFAYVAPDIVLLQAVDSTEFRRAEEALRYTQTVVDKMTDAAYWMDADGRIVYVNEAACATLGYSRDELLSMNIIDIIACITPEAWAAHWEELKQGGARRFENDQVRKDGTLLPVEVQSTYVQAAGREYVCGLARDVSERKAMEAALRAGETKFASLFELGPVGLTITRADNGVFLDANSAFLELAGYPREEVLGRTALGVDLYAYPSERAAIVAEVASTGQIRGWPVTISAKGGMRSECLMSVTTVTVDGVRCYLAGIVDVGPLRQAEAALSAQQADMLALLENADSSIWSIDREYRLTACNTIFRRNTHSSLGHELGIGDFVFQAGVDDTNVEWRRMYDRALAGERFAVDVERRHAQRGNWMEYRFSPVRAADGSVTGVTVLGRDITEQRRVAEQIKAQLAEISFYYDNAPVGLSVFDSDLRYLKINKILAAANGFSMAEHIGKKIEEIVPTAAGAARQIAAIVLATGKPVTDVEFADKPRSDPGVVHHWIAGWYPVMRDGEGVIGFSVIVVDITERKQAEMQLERSRQQLVHAQHIGCLGSWEWDVLHERLEWSDELYRIFGVDREFELSYAGIEAMIHPADRALNDANVQSALAETDRTEFELRIVRPDGELRHIQQSIEVSRDATGAPIRLFGIMQDITEQKRAAAEHEQLQAQLAQAQKMETVGRLAGGIAHDFNNMLAVIMLRSEMALQMVTAGTPLHRSLDTILTTAQRSANLVKQLLGYARKQTIAPKIIDLNATVEGLLPMLAKLMGEELELAWMPAADLWPVKMDSAQVDQILTNLCVNARDAIDGVGCISVKTANAVLPVDSTGAGKHVAPGEYVLLSVADTGGGMAPAVLEHIFEPFYTTKGFGKGTGLGLATVDGIVQQNGGHIVVTSTPGAGTTFTVYLPRHAEAALPPVAQEQPIARDGAGITLLLVEDEVNVLDMAAEVLRMVGYTVLTAGTPTEALRLVEQHEGSIDLLITDVILPVMNGAQLAARVTQRWPGIRTMYVSGYPADHVAHRGVLAEDTHFLAKPFSMQALAGKVREVLTTSAE